MGFAWLGTKRAGFNGAAERFEFGDEEGGHADDFGAEGIVGRDGGNGDGGAKTCRMELIRSWE